jgi:hypothetical protein
VFGALSAQEKRELYFASAEKFRRMSASHEDGSDGLVVVENGGGFADLSAIQVRHLATTNAAAFDLARRRAGLDPMTTRAHHEAARAREIDAIVASRSSAGGARVRTTGFRD